MDMDASWCDVLRGTQCHLCGFPAKSTETEFTLEKASDKLKKKKKIKGLFFFFNVSVLKGKGYGTIPG